MKVYALILLSMMLGLSACGGESHAVHEPDIYVPENYVPQLRTFDIIDSYDVDTAKPNFPPLALNPYLYDGLFEVFWKVNSLEDYIVTLKINDRASLNGSILVHREVCGAGKWCDQAGNLVCEYTTDFYMSCGKATDEVDIEKLFATVPQKLYLLLEVCDSNSSYCEVDYYPVSME